MVGGLAHSGRVIFAAAAVMVAVFFTFALSGPLPPKEMGVILGHRRAPGRAARAAAARAGDAAAARPPGLVPAALGAPGPAGRSLRARLGVALLAVPFGLAIGLAVGTLGGGGSVLAIPVLVYVLGESVHQATTASLLIVVATALIDVAPGG